MQQINIRFYDCTSTSVTRLGILLHFGQLFKACGNNYFAEIAHILRQFLLSCQIISFSSEIIFGQVLKTFGVFLLVLLASTQCNYPTILVSLFVF